jgi:hypothetical protein
MKYAEQTIIDAIDASGGTVYVAAKMLGCAANTVYNYIKRSPEIKASLDRNRATLDLSHTGSFRKQGSLRKGLSGNLYVIRESWHGLVKIGITSNFYHRFAAISSSCPQQLEVLAVVDVDKPRLLEAELHDRYQSYRYSGEWFNLPEHEIDQLLAELSNVPQCSIANLDI